MARMNHVMQIGIVEGRIKFYLEDYVYTYLKKQESTERKKYYVYGERDKKKEEDKLYIYGISDSPQEEHTYFKEYIPLGFLKVKGDEKCWVDFNGQEVRIDGFFVFYASNQAMQEYLVDISNEKNEEDRSIPKPTRKMVRENPPIKETFVPMKKTEYQNKTKVKKKKNALNKLLMPAGCTAAALTLAVTGITLNENKLQQLKKIAVQTLGMDKNDIQEELIVIEEKSDNKLKSQEEIQDVMSEGVIITDFNDKNIDTLQENNQSSVKNTISQSHLMEHSKEEEAEQNIYQSLEETEQNISDLLQKTSHTTSQLSQETEQDTSQLSQKTPQNTFQSSQTTVENNSQNQQKELQQLATEKEAEPKVSLESQEISQNSLQEQIRKDTSKEGRQDSQYKEYIVQEGDTLEGICQKQYGSQLKMKEICNINKIKNADYIAPGQKLYLPK